VNQQVTRVEVGSGALDGITRGGVAAWLGVPYAAPPVGDLRFRSPQPAASWSGVRAADHYGGAATQTGRLGGATARLSASVGEDCLYLNVFSPAAALRDGVLRPVLFWIHGGAYTNGSGAVYDGAPLAELGDIVVVTVNYRLGVFGFVDFASALDADVPSNLGLRDQIAALAWVRDNIAAFGGDPDRVTVAGESAGSASVALLTCAPTARGLFRAAIMQSGTYSLLHGPEVSQEIGRSHARRLGLGPGAGHRLRELPTEQLAAAQRSVDRVTPSTVAASPWFDGDVVPGSLQEAQASPRPDLALLAGHNHDEITFFQLFSGNVLPRRRPELVNRLRAELGWEEADAVLAHYPDTVLGTRALGTDLNFAMPTLSFAERHSAAGGTTFFYRFDAAVPVLGASHAADLVYLWGWADLTALLLRGRATPGRRALAARMRRHWVTFVRDGDPAAWPAYTPADRAVKVLDPAGDRIERDPARVRRLAWAGRDVMPSA
jgi:para-nitrobenzyl esterase